MLINMYASAQVARNTIVEHFTNTWCGICASRNPGFYTNLNAQTNVRHIAYHPSSPYAGCILSQHNVTENNGRTNYYGIFGGTPRLVINGTVIASSANYSSASIFTPFNGQTSAFEISILQDKSSATTITSKVTIKTVAQHSLASASLFTGLAEDTIFYQGPNGEAQHYDVFRKAYNSTTGQNITLAANVGDSVQFTYSTTSSPVWNLSRMFTFAILQETTSKSLLQCLTVPASQNDFILGVEETQEADWIKIYPNPVKDFLIIEGYQNSFDVEYAITDAFGKITKTVKEENKINVRDLKPGVYFLVIRNKAEKKIYRFIKF